MRTLGRVFAVRTASWILFGAAILLALVAIVLFFTPPPPGKANTGAPIWFIWSAFILFFGVALRSGKRALWIATAVIAVPVAVMNTPDYGGFWSDVAPNALALLVVLASAFALVSAVAALWPRSEHAGRASAG